MTLVALQEPAQAGRGIDLRTAERAAPDLLAALGTDVTEAGLRETPRRMACDGLIVARSIPFRSLCMHHLLGVVLESEHLCMSLRGVQKFGARTVTSALHGLVRDDPRTRQEFLALTTRIDHAN